MGCLLELFFEIILEGFFELIVYCHMKLMSLILPNHAFTERTQNKLKYAVKAFSAVLTVVLIIGLFLLIQDDIAIKNIGRYMTYIPLTIMGIQILLGIIVKILKKR